MATVKEYIEQKLSRFNVDCSTIEVKALMAEHSINEGELVTEPAGIAKARQALTSILPELLMIASVSEGGYTVTWNTQGIKDYLAFLHKMNGSVDLSGATIEDSSSLW